MRKVKRIRKNTLINRLPYRKVKNTPNNEPMILQIATSTPIFQSTCPVGMKKSNAELKVPIFTTLAEAEALTKSKPNTLIKLNKRKLPLPGPNTPS